MYVWRMVPEVRLRTGEVGVGNELVTYRNFIGDSFQRMNSPMNIQESLRYDSH